MSVQPAAVFAWRPTGALFCVVGVVAWSCHGDAVVWGDTQLYQTAAFATLEGGPLAVELHSHMPGLAWLWALLMGPTGMTALDAARIVNALGVALLVAACQRAVVTRVDSRALGAALGFFAATVGVGGCLRGGVSTAAMADQLFAGLVAWTLLFIDEGRRRSAPALWGAAWVVASLAVALKAIGGLLLIGLGADVARRLLTDRRAAWAWLHEARRPLVVAGVLLLALAGARAARDQLVLSFARPGVDPLLLSFKEVGDRLAVMVGGHGVAIVVATAGVTLLLWDLRRPAASAERPLPFALFVVALALALVTINSFFIDLALLRTAPRYAAPLWGPVGVVLAVALGRLPMAVRDATAGVALTLGVLFFVVAATTVHARGLDDPDPVRFHGADVVVTPRYFEPHYGLDAVESAGGGLPDRVAALVPEDVPVLSFAYGAAPPWRERPWLLFVPKDEGRGEEIKAWLAPSGELSNVVRLSKGFIGTVQPTPSPPPQHQPLWLSRPARPR